MPVTVHRSAAVTFFLLAAGGAGTAPLSLVDAVALTGVITFAALAHELGHASVAKGLGLRDVEIILTSFGGLTRFPDPSSPTRRLAIALAGPAAGIALGLVSLAASALFMGLLQAAPLAWRVAWAMVHINLAWSLLNLLPVGPLDGRAIRDELGRLRSGSAAASRRAALWVWATVGAGVVGLGLSWLAF